MPQVLPKDLTFPRLQLVDQEDAVRFPEGYLEQALNYEFGRTQDLDLGTGGAVRMWFVRNAEDTSPIKVHFRIDRAGRPVCNGNCFGLRPILVDCSTNLELDFQY